ncbi:hypothetical protein DPMN_164822 [Dreissena polymorpha]|uniref:Uncharacterized protein n=1 Tax=Dreissena polymorpha TaxID=45954 RepID=A0A9D4EVT3_DREPO|nr:hypothetical protein DPMN_164822 [Dreissena polymorpha]
MYFVAATCRNWNRRTECGAVHQIHSTASASSTKRLLQPWNPRPGTKQLGQHFCHQYQCQRFALHTGNY